MPMLYCQCQNKTRGTTMKQIIAIIAIAVGFSVFADSAVSRKSDVNSTFSLNADWRFTKAPETIPLTQAKASVETNGVKIEDPAFDDSAWETVSVRAACDQRARFVR